MTSMPWEDDSSHEGLLARRQVSLCLSEREIDEYRRNCLSGVTREVVEEHLLVCARCLDRVEDEDHFAAAFCAAARQLEVAELEAALRDPPEESEEPPGEPRVRAPLRLWGQLKSWFARPVRRGAAFGWAAACAVTLIGLWSFERSDPSAQSDVEVVLEVSRGASPLNRQPIPANRPILLSSDISDLPPAPVYRLDLVDQSGQLVHRELSAPAEGRLRWRLGSGLAQGTYWVRVCSPRPSSFLLREFGLRVR